MTREEIIKYLNIIKAFFLGSEHQPISDAYFALDEAIKALEREPCEDCISRQAVEKITWEEPSYTDALNVLTEVRDKVRALPSVKPQEPKIGHWVNRNGIRYCEFCGASNSTAYTSYCPNCGAKMESEE